MMTAGPNPLQGLAHDTTPPPNPGAIVPAVHQPFGVQHFGKGAPMFPLAPDIGRSRAELFYPVRMDVAFDMAQVMDHPVQVEQDPGFLPDLFFYQHPSGLDVQFPSAQLPTHYPLEGVTYNNVQLTEDDFLAIATQRVRSALGGQ